MAPGITTAVPAATRANSTLKGAADCRSARCGMDAGCRKESDGSFICICTHDLLPPRPDGSCPRFVVSGPHNPTPNKKTFITIRRTSDKDPAGSINSSTTTTTQTLPAIDSGLDTSTSILIWVLPLLGILAAVAASIWLKRRWQKRKGLAWAASRPRNSTTTTSDANQLDHDDVEKSRGIVCLTKNVLNQERFMANPEYDWNGTEQHQADPLLSNRDPAGSPTNDQFKAFHIIRPDWIKLEQEIGEGCFGKVYRGSLITSGSPENVAVKVLKGAAGPSAQEELLQEAEIMASFSHSNILALKGIVLNGTNNPTPWLVFEYMALGDLAQLLRSSNGNNLVKSSPSTQKKILEQEHLYSIAQQIADGMAYLSSQHFVHRDLACRNCLVGEDPSKGLIVKISDFGMSRDVYTCDYYKIGGSRMLPVRWMSPESILYGKFTLESDVWSYGVVLWEVFALGVQPYYGHSNEQVVKLILQGILLTPPDLAPPLICQLLNGCWKTQPSDRITFAEIHSKLHRRNSFKQHRQNSSSSDDELSPKTVTYVHLRHERNDDYLQPLPDLHPHHTYSNTQI